MPPDEQNTTRHGNNTDQSSTSQPGRHTVTWTLLTLATAVLLVITEKYFGFLLVVTETDAAHGYSSRTCPPPETNVTLVTGFIDIGRGDWKKRWRRSPVSYFKFASPVLALNSPMVVYVDPKFVPLVREMRHGKLEYTKIIPVARYDLELHQLAGDVRAVMESRAFRDNHHLVGHPEGFSPLYNIVTNSKIHLMLNASEENHFGSEHFYWLDFGYGHGNVSIFPRACSTWLPSSIMSPPVSDQITYLINYEDFGAATDNKLTIYDVIKQPILPIVIGGFFGGSAEAVRKYYNLHKKVFAGLLRENLVADDQALAIACYFKDSSLFNLVHGSWFDAFTIFGPS